MQVRKITLSTEPEGAQVYQVSPLDGSQTFLGTTPLRDQSVLVMTGAKLKGVSAETAQSIVSRIERVQVMVQKSGHRTYRGSLPTERDGRVAAHHITLEPEPAGAAAK